MWKNKVETEIVETPKVEEFPKKYIHKDNNTELMFWNSKFSRWKVIITDLEQENILKGTLDYQYWFITLQK
jgi:uncharacterized cupin superfamily protein